MSYDKVSEEEEQKEGILEKDQSVTFDDVLKIVGEFGKYQKILYFLFSFPYVFTSMQLLGWVFIGAELPHRCVLPNENQTDNFDGRSFHPNDTNTSNFDPYVIVWKKESEIKQSCSYKIDSRNLTNGCDNGYIYDTSVIGDSVVKEFDLVCKDESWHATIGAAPMFGYLFGGIVFGTFSDKIGRKPTFFIANILLLLSGLLAAISPEYFLFTSSRVLAGLAIAGVENSCFVMGMELVGPSKRTLAGILCWFFETSGLLLTVTLAYFYNENWRILQIMYSLPCVLFLAYWWIAPESIRWLISQGKKQEARKLIQKTATINKVDLEDSIIDTMEQTIEKELLQEGEISKQYTALDLFRYPNLRIKTLVLFWTWIVCSALYYVLLLDQSELSDDPFIGFLITASVQLPGYVYVIITVEKPAFGRKRSMSGFLLLAGIMLIAHPFVPKGQKWLRIGLSTFGRFCANCSYTILNLFSAEQFPTVVRGVGMGLAYVVSRIGTILAPYILLIGAYSPTVFGFGALLAGLLSLLLPETLGEPLPESLEDGEKFGIAKIKITGLPQHE